MTFGAPGPHLERLLDYMKTRQYAIDGWRASPLTQEMTKLANASGVSVRDMLKESQERPPPYVSAGHRQLPY